MPEKKSNHARPRLALPVGGAARLFSLDISPEHQWCVLVAPKATGAMPEALTRPGQVSALLTHDLGRYWPDSYGEKLAFSVLDQGGTIALAFVSLADALHCKRRLEGGKG